jgi:hypothetical protein
VEVSSSEGFPGGGPGWCGAAAYAGAGLATEELWLAYFALGGNAGRYEVEP